ncbi:MAG: 16S rRNA (cytosine(1402)-N(4))-methyltransferase RsmH [Proteobacteria bacterium]|nr:16S rRNA (cytosine(1402)-N(4))-methyltransferase RsmH [Desulfobacula sp.]MBU4133124.1 16S rRNA (cytosine(1402)-N(4))-methyltransferase RsmH [Pseudomonadota bacterium]
MGFEHTSVMPKEVHEYQNLKPGDICVDCTLGGSGHALSTIRAILPNGTLLGIDQDMDAIDNAKKVLNPFEKNIRLFHSNFSKLPEILESCGITGVNSILLDLGFSFNQLVNGNRGFSFNKDEPLDMRMDIRTPLTARQVINTYTEKDLVNIFFKFGEERFSRKLTRTIIKKREEAPIETSKELAQILVDATPAKQIFAQKIHPATRVFQALRIEVNQELAQLETFMKDLPSLLVKGGRVCIISFHSLEDRIVKHGLRKFEAGCTCPRQFPHCMCGFVPMLRSILKKPLLPTQAEIDANPMARSSKLRVAERI